MSPKLAEEHTWTPVGVQESHQDADPYLLGNSAAEVEHLVMQADVYAPEAEQLLDLIGVPMGASAIDLGCGALGILHVLCGRVGAQGRVVGLDREPSLLATAERLARERGLEVQLVRADATSSGLPSDSFDLVHTRAVLVNVSNPAEIVAEMVRLAKPGGVVALQEPDCSCWVCDPPHPAWAPLRDALLDAYQRNGKDAGLGRRAGRLLREAGLSDVHVQVTAAVREPGDYYQTLLLTLSTLVREQIMAGDRLTADELDRCIADLREHANAQGTVTCLPVWQAWGTA
jgi:ubiquinone/menaquinone biosynthesis C-methylase UbiE